VRKIVVIAPADARHGFALAGVRQVTSVPAELEATLGELLRDPATGVVIVDERLVAGPAQQRLRELERRSAALVVVLPAPGEAARIEEDYVLRLIRRAIGYQVRLSP
jgi:vacuolar-type H+-ATPase subunit F/Vma7